MVISTEQQYNEFLTECTNSDCIFFIITNSNNIHPAISEPILLFIKNVTKNKEYILNIKHYDFEYRIGIEALTKDLNELKCNKFVIDKKKFLHSLSISNLKDLQLVDFIKYGRLQESCVIPPSYNIFYNKFQNKKNINQIIPSAVHLQLFKNSCDLYEENVEDFQYDEIYENINTHIIENLQKIEMNGIHVNTDSFYTYFPNTQIAPIENKVYTSYNIYTSTGRPSNSFGGINYAALKKENSCRSTFISRYGKDGMLLLIDYSAYHPHIVAKLINYNLPADAYNYLGKYYYGRDVLSEEELKDAKNITFQCMYGNIPEELLVIPYFNRMSEYINHRWDFFIKNEYVETPIYKRRITTDNIYEPNPNKLFNYILQASETEFGMVAIENVNEYLKNKKTKAILYTYDSLLFDIHKDDGKDTVIDLKNIMAQRGFPVKCYIGYDYDNMQRVNI